MSLGTQGRQTVPARPRAERPGWLATTPRRVAGLLLHPGRLVALGQSLVLLAAAEVAVRTVRVERAAAWFGADMAFTEPGPRIDGQRLDLRARERTTLRVLSKVAPHWPFSPTPGGSCLRHSLAAAYVVRRHRPELRLGVAAGESRRVLAHAWTEVRGIPVTNPGNSAPLLAVQAKAGTSPS